ncbi:COG3904 family protein [Tropicibacter oceani]|uniref:ATP-dependent Clp protease proteolytic subunit n=1 Tax=Tropicibacter oceani TaxID=3058420 RepID=A0ABY8QFX5_9RHOB|nr:ATP-dependent Clp protease proteolytic subunit [Tropicibacter oceani]WGW03430.1 ATP-dependent Clp protease proteolytic subunit [Tropicibacter oceani]
MKASTVARTLSAVLIFQLGIGAFLVLSDMQAGAFSLPRLSPDAPRLSEPIRPGDQTRRFAPDRDRPAVRPARDPGQLPDRLTLTQEGGAWRLEGAIAPDDAPRIITQLSNADPAIETLILQSPGGSVRDALEIGRHLRASDIATQVLPGEYCYSACPYLLAGGPTRTIAPAASIGVHQHSFGENTLLPAFMAVSDIQRGQAEVMEYLDEMGIDTRVMRHALATPADEIYVLIPEELERYGFVTKDDS